MAAFKKTLTLQNENCWNGGKFTSQFAMEKHLTTWRNSPDTPWLRDSPRSAQIKAIEDLDRTFKDFFEKRADIPCFKRKGQSADSFRSPDKKAITLVAANGRIKLPKLGRIRYRNSRVVLGDPAQRHRIEQERQVVCVNPDAARSRTAGSARPGRRDRRRHRALCDPERWLAWASRCFLRDASFDGYRAILAEPL